jgi:hypothetical protein
MVAFHEALKTYLASLGHGPFVTDSLPDSPVNVICLYDSGGAATALDENAPGAPELIDVQIRARNQSQGAARDALLAIQEDLHTLSGVNIGDWTILVAVANDRPAILTREDKGAWSLVANYEITAQANV